MRQKWMPVILAVLSAAVILAGCKQNVGTPEDNAVVEEPEEENEDPAGGRLIGFSCPDLEDPFYAALKESVKAALSEQGDEILVQSAGDDARQQNVQIQEMISSGIDALIFWPVDSEESEQVLEDLDQSDIPVINLGVKMENTDLPKVFIGFDEENAGRVCAEDLKERKPEGGTLVIIESPDQVLINERITGFEKEIANSGFEVVARINAGTGSDIIESRLSEILSENKVLDAVMCGSDWMAVKTLETLEEAGRRDVLVYTVGGSPEVKSAFTDPASPLTGAGALSPINMAKTAAAAVSAIFDRESYEEEVNIETFLINRTNIEIYGTDGWQ